MIRKIACISCLAFLLLVFSGCANTRITDDPVEDAYLGETTTFEGDGFYPGTDMETAFAVIKQALLDNRFKLTESDIKDMRMVASREIQSGYVTVTTYLYPVSEGVRIRVVTQVPRGETGYYRLHEEILSQFDQ
jgi:hypothetical protein